MWIGHIQENPVSVPCVYEISGQWDKEVFHVPLELNSCGEN